GRGWAVLLPNFRGSDGFGEAFTRNIIGNWAEQPLLDIMAGVDHVIALGIADPERLAVEGESYGGYLTAWTGKQTTRFKAACVQFGMVDLESGYGETEYMDGQMAGYLGGPPTKAARDTYRALSPLSFADAVKTPTLIMHGTEDRTVLMGQSL